MSGDKLLPCPFCGKAARRSMVTVEEPFLYLVGCSDCPVAMDWQRTEDEATAAWNRRTNTTTELAEALRLALRVIDDDPAIDDWDEAVERARKALILHDRALGK